MRFRNDLYIFLTFSDEICNMTYVSYFRDYLDGSFRIGDPPLAALQAEICENIRSQVRSLGSISTIAEP